MPFSTNFSALLTPGSPFRKCPNTSERGCISVSMKRKVGARTYRKEEETLTSREREKRRRRTKPRERRGALRRRGPKKGKRSVQSGMLLVKGGGEDERECVRARA